MSRGLDRPPRRLAVAVALVAAAMLLVELFVTRLFSVLFFYHYSFFAISLVMSGLVLGGLLAARTNAAAEEEAQFRRRMANLAWAFAASTLAAIGVVVVRPVATLTQKIPVGSVLVYAALFLVGLVAAGAFLASAFARRREWIGALYAWDLLAAATACAAAIVLLRAVQGPAVFLVPTLLAAGAAHILAGRWSEAGLARTALTAVAAALLVASLATDGRLLRLRSLQPNEVLFERWNEHSRIRVLETEIDRGHYVVIDRSAGTFMPPIPPAPGGAPVPAREDWKGGPQYIVYELGRPLGEVAIIGVGGGGDLLPPVAYGATRIDGYEMNAILIDLLAREFRGYNAIASRPEIALIHDEARVGITHSGKRYDVIQASLIDTWAATASGGFVLTENGLYTREGWRAFLGRLSDTGVLTMTRWYIPDAPAEAERLVSLAAASLADAGVADPRRHLLLATSRSEGVAAFSENELGSIATVLVSKQPFTSEETRRVGDEVARHGGSLLAAPGIVSADPTIDRLLDPATRERAIAESPFNISAPSDSRPYFFLQIRPGDLVNLSRSSFGAVTEITFNGVRVLMILVGCSLALVAAVVLLALLGLPGATTDRRARSTYRRFAIYFLGIGFGYILVQLALHQRLVIALGRPTFALSVVLFAMLLGTGLGSAASGRLVASGRPSRAGLAILAVLAPLCLALPWTHALELVRSQAARLAIAGLLIGGVGFVLGLAFPLGARRVARTGEWAVQKMWAVNGAASVAGSALAAFVGLTAGSTAVLAVGAGFYALATAAAWLAERDEPGG